MRTATCTWYTRLDACQLSAAQAILPEAVRPVIFGLATAFPSATLRALEVRQLLCKSSKDHPNFDHGRVCHFVLSHACWAARPAYSLLSAGGANDAVQQLSRPGRQRMARPREPECAGDRRAGTRLAVVVTPGGHGTGPLRRHCVSEHRQC